MRGLGERRYQVKGLFMYLAFSDQPHTRRQTPHHTESNLFTVFYPLFSSIYDQKTHLRAPLSLSAVHGIRRRTKMGGKNRKSSNKAKTRKPRNASYSGRGLFVEGGVLSDWAVYNSPPSRGSCFFFFLNQLYILLYLN